MPRRSRARARLDEALRLMFSAASAIPPSRDFREVVERLDLRHPAGAGQDGTPADQEV